MTPSPQEDNSHVKASKSDGERVVISGMSGLYPNARHVKDLSEILYNKIDPITSENRRWDFKHPDLSNYIGMVPGLNRFDSQFFKLSDRTGNTLDVIARKLLEQTYQAIYDAGLSSEHLCGKKVGVFVGSCFSETTKGCFSDDSKVDSGLIGCCKNFFSNRISYWLDVKGPSYSVDQSCCSSIAVLEAAFLAIERGECEAAIVGSGSVCLHPQTMIHFSRAITLSPSGKTKSFDENADGCVKSEAINVLFLQKAKDAMRIYADVVHVKSIFSSIVEGENGPKLGFHRDGRLMAANLKEFYKEANVSPNDVQYVEAFSAGSKEIDRAELEAFDEVFCELRQDPLIVGSVMSNIGYTEAASGIASIVKVLIGYQTGKIAANLNCANPRQDIAALKDKRMIIATDHQPIHRSYMAINNLSYNGVNAHVLLKGHFKPKNSSRYKTALPRLVMVSGRHKNAVKRILDDLKSRPIDPEELALLHNIHEKRINGHLGRGYAIFDANSDGTTLRVGKKVDHFDDVGRPLWFVYNGMGSQWNQMGLHLMRIPIFADSITRCHEVLKPKGIDLIDIITTEDKTIFNNILYAFVGITAIHIGLTDVLKNIGVVPDNIIGHSLGEVGCAYADGALTLEETILTAYARGRVSVDVPVIKGCMAAVGMGYQQIKDICPSEITVACHNGPNSCTLSGPAESMNIFVENLSSQGIFAKKVESCNIAYHSKYIIDMGEPHLKLLKEIIKTPKPRSQRWISSSVEQGRWHEEIAKYSCSEYYNNNMLNPVLFEESLKLVPSNAVLIEIGPHGLLQAILKRSLSSNCHHIPLTRRGHPDNVIHLLNALGSLYMVGYNPQIAKLYPKVEFPVSAETASLSHLVEWMHDEQCDIVLYNSGEMRMSSTTKHLITLHDDEFQYLRGNVVRGRILYPFAAMLVAVWDTLAMSLGFEKKKFSILFRDVHLFAQPILHEQRQLKLNVFLHRGTGRFEVSDNFSKVATGYIIGSLKDVTLPNIQFESTEPLNLESKDVYELLHEKDYSYRDEFRTIHKANESLTEAQLLWTDNWVTLIDGVLQLNALRVSHSTVCQPKFIRRICIDVDDHINKTNSLEDKKIVTAHISNVHDFTKCGGLALDNIIFHKLPPLIEDSVALKAVNFFPHFQYSIVNIKSALGIYIEILRDNVIKDIINVVGLSRDSDETIFKQFEDVIKHSDVKINYNEISEDKIEENKGILSRADLVLTKNLSIYINISKVLYELLDPKAFVLNFNIRMHEENLSPLYRIITSINTGEIILELTKLGSKPKYSRTVVSVVSQDDVTKLNTTLESIPLHNNILVIATTPVLPGLKEHIKECRKKIGTTITMVTIDQAIKEDKSLNCIPELAFSVLKNGVWGGEYLLPWEPKTAVSHDVMLQSTQIGNIQSMQWVEATESDGRGISVDVHYAGLNDSDGKRAMGTIPFEEDQDFVYGMDFSGKTQSGASVMGLISNGAIRSKVLVNPELLWNVPLDWSLEEAATVPLAYSMAFYCLKLKADLAIGMTILIMGGAGALGQAAISITLAHNCKVFATVSDDNKKQLLLKLFPDLDEKNIGYSRDSQFEHMVLNATKGKGCDIVITCANGELKDMSLNCCAFSGVTVDTVQIQSKEKYAFGLHHLTKQRSYVAADFSSIFECIEDMQRIKELVSEGIEKSYVKPLTYITFGPKDVVGAFRLLESSRRSGRVLISLCDSTLEAQTRFTCSPSSWQIVLCDDVTGLQFTEKLIHHGARRLLLNYSNQSGYLQVKLRSWVKYGVEIDISTEDMTKPHVAESILNNISRKGEVEGIFIFIKNTKNQEQEASVDKLDTDSRKLCPSLKKFVVASSSHSFGEKLYLTRSQDQLPISVVHLPVFPEADGQDNCSSVSERVAINTTLKIIVASTVNIFVYPKESKRVTMLEELANITAVEIPKNVSVDTTLQDLGILGNKIQIIKSYLRDTYNTYFEDNVVTSLTVQQIREIENNAAWHGFDDLKGLQIFYSHIGSDEVLASIPTVVMKTRAKYWREYEFDVNITSLCVIPGLEGHHERFQIICERLKLPAFTIQPGFLKSQESIQTTAHRYAQILIKKIKNLDNFYLLGYESGVLVALETAKILESYGGKGTIFCVGQTPKELKKTVEEIIEISSKGGVKMEDAIAKCMVNLIKNDDNAFAKIETQVKDVSNWKDKLEICLEELVGHNGHTYQFMEGVMNTALGRILQLRSYEVKEFELVSKIVLIHSESSFDSTTIQSYSKQPVVVYKLDTPLGHLGQDLRCATIINQHLSQDVIDLFVKNNLCETYTVNGNRFLFTACHE